MSSVNNSQESAVGQFRFVPKNSVHHSKVHAFAEIFKTGFFQYVSLEKFENNLDRRLLNIPHQTSRVKFQCKEYRKIYERIKPAYDTPNNALFFKTLHIPELEKLFENGIALTLQCIKDEFINSAISDKEAAEFISRLIAIYQNGILLNSNENFSEMEFFKLNYDLAVLVEELKTHQSFNLKEDSDLLVNLKGIEQSFKLYNKHPFNPLMIIYGNPKKRTDISYDSFVDELLAPYKGSLLLFDFAKTNNIKIGKIGSKNDPHYSEFNKTPLMLSHDFGHYLQIRVSDLEGLKADKYFENKHIFQYLEDIRNKYKSNANAYKVLTRALFILLHEDSSIILNCKNVTELIDNLCTFLKKATWYDRMNNNYKTLYRDNEAILFSNKVSLQNDRGEPFVSEPLKGKSNERKQELIRQGYNAFCEYLLGLIKQEEQKRKDDLEAIIGYKGIFKWEFPNEIHKIILGHLTADQRLALTRVSKTWAELMMNFPKQLSDTFDIVDSLIESLQKDEKYIIRNRLERLNNFILTHKLSSEFQDGILLWRKSLENISNICQDVYGFNYKKYNEIIAAIKNLEKCVKGPYDEIRHYRDTFEAANYNMKIIISNYLFNNPYLEDFIKFMGYNINLPPGSSVPPQVISDFLINLNKTYMLDYDLMALFLNVMSRKKAV